MLLIHFDMLMLKIIFFKLYIFDVFFNKKYFKKQPLPHF